MKAMPILPLLPLIASLSGCGDEQSRMRGEFVSGCIHSGASKSACACIFDTITEKHTPNTLMKLMHPDTSPTDPLVQDFKAAALSCRGE